MPQTKILFVCTMRGARAQIASHLARELSGDGVSAFASGFERGPIRGLPFEVAEGLGISLEETGCDTVFERCDRDETYDHVVTMCSESRHKQCPIFSLNVNVLFSGEARRHAWAVDDFANLDGTEDERRRRIANIIWRIHDQVLNLLKVFEHENAIV